MFRRRSQTFAAALLMGLASIAGAQTSYSYTDLGTLGGTMSQANGVNDAGQMVGISSLANGQQHGFYWSGSGAIVDIGTLGGTGSYASEINNGGDIVGSASLASGANRAIYCSSSSPAALVDLNTVVTSTDNGNPADWVLTNAWDINDSRRVIGIGTRGGTTHGYLLDMNTGLLTDLGSLRPDGINDLPTPQLSCWPASAAGAVLYPSLTNLLPMIRAFSINDAGAVVGYLGNSHAAFRSAAGVITDLGSFYGLAQGYSINNASPAKVVGNSQYSQPGRSVSNRAFRWTVGGGAIQDLNSVTLNLGKKPWVLVQARCVSDTGYIACSGEKSGVTRAFRLNPNP